ncbi:MAG: 7-cyano-7-deazaguanine synthase QueC [Thermoplasmata archaeon]
MKVVSLLSGGLDSTTVTAYALSKHYDVFPLTFLYGQRHKKELNSAKKVADFYKLPLKIIKLDLRAIGGSALTSNIPVPEQRNIEDMSNNIPVTYVPARNTIFLSYALGFAEVINAKKIFIGANAIDYSGYPDCRPEYFRAFNKLANLATKAGVEGSKIKIEAPLLNMSKAEIIKLGTKLNVPYNLTWSCYEGKEKACGKCDSCLLRLKGFMEAGKQDPIDYVYYPDFYKKYVRQK